MRGQLTLEALIVFAALALFIAVLAASANGLAAKVRTAQLGEKYQADAAAALATFMQTKGTFADHGHSCAIFAEQVICGNRTSTPVLGYDQSIRTKLRA